MLQCACGSNKLIETAYMLNAVSFFSVDRISKVSSSLAVKQSLCTWEEYLLIRLYSVRYSHNKSMS